MALHSGKVSKVKLCPDFAGRGRYFDFKSRFIPASIDFAEESPLCTTLSKDGVKVRTVEHLLSALEAMGVDNCRIEIENVDAEDSEVEVFCERDTEFTFLVIREDNSFCQIDLAGCLKPP